MRRTMAGEDRTPPVAPGRLPVAGHLMKLLTDPLSFLQSLSGTDAVTIYVGTRPMYVINSHELIHAMLVSKADQCARGAIFETATRVLGKSLVVTEGETHKRQRRMLQPFFQQEQIARYTTVMADVASTMSCSWKPRKPLSINTEMHQLGLDMVTRALFGTDIAVEARTAIQRVFPAVLKGITAQTLYPAQWMEKLPLPINRRFRSVFPQMKRIVDELIAGYQSAEITDEDLLALLVSARDPRSGRRMSAEEVRDQVITLLLVGTETSSTTLSWLFHEIARHPDVENRLLDELASELGSRRVRYADLQRLTYTDDVLKEVLRLHTPNWLLMRRAEETLDLGNFRIPAGGDLVYSLTALHRNPELYDNPLRFDPARWSDGRTDDLPRTAFIPFGVGRHKCIGDSFAWSEMMVTAATVIRDWRLVPTPGTRVKERPWTTVQPHGLSMTPIPRPATALS